MTGKLSKNFHGVGIGPLSKILAVNVVVKEYLERRFAEPVLFLFLPEMGLLGIQANSKKNPSIFL